MVGDRELRADNRGLSGWLLVATAVVAVLGSIGYLLS